MIGGAKSLEILHWLEKKPENVTAIKGNHDEEFAEYIRLMEQIDKKNELMTDPDSNEDAKILLDSVRYMFKQKQPLGLLYFDYYNTITDLINKRGVTFGELICWADMLRNYAYTDSFSLNGRDVVVVHAGYCEDSSLLDGIYKGDLDFCLYARDDAIELGGFHNGMVIAGHTPTIAEESLFYNDGKVFRYHDTDKDCIFYDIDCGCAYREMYPSGKMACLRIDDEKVFYI